MYISRIHLQNWRSYADAVFQFDEPRRGRPLVLVGAMNGHGKTSFLISLYLGIFGRFGLRRDNSVSQSGSRLRRKGGPNSTAVVLQREERAKARPGF